MVIPLPTFIPAQVVKITLTFSNNEPTRKSLVVSVGVAYPSGCLVATSPRNVDGVVC